MKPTTKFEIWLEAANKKRLAEMNSLFPKTTHKELTYTKGRKFVKILADRSVWGFVAMTDGSIQGVPYRKGDLLKAAGWRTPAKHSRGNIFDGTDKWSWTGPHYLL